MSRNLQTSVDPSHLTLGRGPPHQLPAVGVAGGVPWAASWSHFSVDFLLKTSPQLSLRNIDPPLFFSGIFLWFKSAYLSSTQPSWNLSTFHISICVCVCMCICIYAYICFVNFQRGNYRNLFVFDELTGTVFHWLLLVIRCLKEWVSSFRKVIVHFKFCLNEFIF